jgi:UPF0755 protein
MTFKRVIVSFTIILILAIAGSLLWLRQELRTPKTHSQSEQYIAIPKGSTPDQIINNLETRGVIGRGWLLRLYLRVTGSGQRLKAGEYRFPSPISPLGVLRKLEEGEQRLSRLTRF